MVIQYKFKSQISHSTDVTYKRMVYVVFINIRLKAKTSTRFLQTEECKETDLLNLLQKCDKQIVLLLQAWKERSFTSSSFWITFKEIAQHSNAKVLIPLRYS